jgi:hypothetical protein
VVFAAQLFMAARCFRNEFRREIFAFVAYTGSCFDEIAGGGRLCRLSSVPAKGINGWVACISLRSGG